MHMRISYPVIRWALTLGGIAGTQDGEFTIEYVSHLRIGLDSIIACRRIEWNTLVEVSNCETSIICSAHYCEGISIDCQCSD